MKSTFLGPSQQYAILSVAWKNPYTKPSKGKRVLWAASVPLPLGAGYTELFPKEKPPEGYGHHINFHSIKPLKQWSAEAMATNRMNRLKKRAEKKTPLFAGQFIQKRVDKDPSYFDAEAIKENQAVREKLIKQYAKDHRDSFASIYE